MLYLKSLVLDKFKSFRNAELLFSRGFTCVVGPNGSGKSVIFDSIMFGLGEPSLRVLRVDRLEELINRNVRRKAGEPTLAHVKMEFEGDGQSITVIKSVRSDSKASYKINGKATTKKEVVEVLSKGGVRVDDTTTIAQGDINSIAELNSAGRRELIDTAAGIRDFERKKDEAMRELDKVDQKVGEANIMLGERQGVLSELEKDKEAAESYSRMSTRLRTLRYSILVARQRELRDAFDASTKEIVALESKKSESQARLSDLSSKRDLLGMERSQITRELNKITTTSGETAARLEMINRELAKLEVEMPALQRSIAEAAEFVARSGAEAAEANEKAKQNRVQMDSISGRVSELEKELSKFGVIPEGFDIDTEAKSLDLQISEDENRLIDVHEYISKLQAELSLLASKKADSEKQAQQFAQDSKRLDEKRAGLENELAQAKARAADMADITARLAQDHSKLSRRLYDIDGSIMTLREQRAIAQSREGNLHARISERFKEKDGFFGKASGLCKFESKYTYAVEAAASSRFEYFVVDSMEVADSIISYLKKNNIGKATFIPIAELNSDRKQVQEQGMTPVIDVVKFDARFSKVFSYIFNNTYLIDSMLESKKRGVGRHRYVTLEGDLVEQSGVVSGGYSKRVSLAAIEARIKDLEAERDGTRKNADLAEVGLKEAEKEKALLGMRLQNMASELQGLRNESERTAALLLGSKELLKSIASDEAKTGKELLSKDSEKLELATVLEDRRKSRNALYGRLTSAAKGAGASKLRAEKEKADSIRNEIEANKIRKAELNKEAQMLAQKAADIASAAAARHKQSKALNSELAEKEIGKGVLLKSRMEIQKEMAGKSESSKKHYERISAIEAEINRLSSEYGRLEAEQSGLERQAGDIRVKRSQSETRLNDITAELTAYDKIDPEQGRIDEMETEANILVAKIQSLGAVNMRAPELYEERKKMADEARSRVATLQTEKDAVLRMIEEIDSKKLQTFMEMLGEVNKNFGRMYNYVFPGRALLALEDDKNPLESGIHIRMTDGKSKVEIPIKSLSGGQKSMMALMLLFSIHLCKKSSLYLFDEVDAALDAENAKLLSRLVKEMSREAQFIVISHNNSLIVNADTAIGVTMDADKKESNAVGLEVGSIIRARPKQ